MTIGLTTLDSDGSIILATESKGIPSFGLGTKILRLPETPEIRVLAGGGLERWAYVVSHFRCPDERSGEAICREIARLLEDCTEQQRPAFGLICGFTLGVPRCYRMNHDQANPSAQAPLEHTLYRVVQAIGEPDLAHGAKGRAEAAMRRGCDPCQALVEAILEALPDVPDEKLDRALVRAPVHIERLRPPVG